MDSKEDRENKCPCVRAQQGHRSRAQWGSEARIYAGGRVRAENQGQSEVEMIPQRSVKEESVPREHRRGNQHSTQKNLGPSGLSVLCPGSEGLPGGEREGDAP